MDYIQNDEPVTEDKLDRLSLARTFAGLAGDCQTPLVVGIYASWGMGKTSFMKLIEGELARDSARTVWFNAWQHDQDTAPALSLLHAMVDALEMRQEFKHALGQVAMAFGSVLLQKTTTLTLENLQKVQTFMDEESFRVRDARSNLRNYFVEVLAKARRKGIERIVFFIDDLDRCAAKTVMNTLEAIKLYFNLEGCVFFLGIDRHCIEAAIDASHVASDRKTQYLDKLIQLPFSLPALTRASFQRFIEDRLPLELSPCLPLIHIGLERNPRTAKRFINDLCLRHRFATSLNIHGYDPRLLALLLLVEYLDPPLFSVLVDRPGVLLELFNDRPRAAREIRSPRLAEAIFSSYVPQYASIESYVSLTTLSSVESDLEHDKPDVAAMLSAHHQWLRSNGTAGQRAVFSNVALSGEHFAGRLLREADFEGAVLMRCDFTGADLRRAMFAGASLSEARFDGSNLRFADLREADLRGGILRGADLRGADLRRTNLRGADLRKSIGLSREQIGESMTDAHTRLPTPLCLPYRPGLLRPSASSPASD